MKNALNIVISKITKNIDRIILGAVIFINSGLAFINFGVATKFKIILLVASLSLTILIFFLTRDFSWVKDTFGKNRKYSIKRLFLGYILRPDVITMILVLLLSLINFLISLITGKELNINTILGVTAFFMMAFLITNIMTKKSFFNLFSNIIFITSIVAIMFSLTLLITKTPFNTGSFWSSLRSYDSYMHVFYTYTSTVFNDGLKRTMGIFWEPGLFANFILIAIILELFYLKKTSYPKIFIFIICLLFTKSTAAFFIFAIIVIAFIFKNIKVNISYIVLYLMVLFVPIIFIYYDEIFGFLAKILPSIFAKMITYNSSLVTRVESPKYFFLIFLERPLSGWGFDRSMTRYLAIKPPIIDSATSTFAYLISSLGLSGILISVLVFVGIFKINSKSLNIPTRIMIALALFIISNTEVQLQVLGLLCIYYYGIKENSRYKMEKDSITNESTLLHQIVSGGEQGKFSSNIIGSAFLKFSSIILGLLTIPAFSSFFKDDNLYGAWLTMISVITIILSFDFGITDGLKNKLIQAKAENNIVEQKRLVSSSYFITGMIGLAFVVICSVLVLSINLNSLFNIDENIIPMNTLKVAMLIILFTIGFEMFLKNVTSILSAYGKVVVGNSLMFISNLLLIAFAYVMRDIIINKILVLSIAYFVAITLPLILPSVYVFRNMTPGISPSYKFLDKNSIKKVSNLGLKFFIIQICSIILWGFNDFFIANLFSPANVVDYQKYYKLFSTIISLYAIIQPTLWVYLVKAKSEKNFAFMKKIVILSVCSSAVLIVCVILAAGLSQVIFNIWLGSASIKVDFAHIFPFVLYGIIYSCFCTISLLCYSFEILKSFTYVASIISFVKIPLIYIMCRIFFDAGWIVVMWVNIILIIPYVFVPMIELVKKLSGKEYKHV